MVGGDSSRPVRDVGRRIRVAAGTVLFRPNDECPGFVLVEQGAIKVSLVAASGREIVLYRVTPGDVCLQTFTYLVDNRPYTAEGVAETEVEAVLVPKAAFEQRFLEDREFRSQVFAAIARRFTDFEQVVETLAFTALETRVAAALLRLADEDGIVRATHDVVAMEIGSVREAVSRQLGALSRQGLVKLARGEVQLRDAAALRRLVRHGG